MKGQPSLNPQVISETVWYYENRGHIEVHVEPSTIHRSFKIPKYRLERSLKRMGQEPERRKQP